MIEAKEGRTDGGREERRRKEGDDAQIYQNRPSPALLCLALCLFFFPSITFSLFFFLARMKTAMRSFLLCVLGCVVC